MNIPWERQNMAESDEERLAIQTEIDAEQTKLNELMTRANKA